MDAIEANQRQAALHAAQTDFLHDGKPPEVNDILERAKLYAAFLLIESSSEPAPFPLSVAKHG